VSTNHPTRWGRRLAPYLLAAPAVLWLTGLFLIPLITMLVKSLETCDPITNACTLTWHWGAFSNAYSLYHHQLWVSLEYALLATVVDLVLSFPIAYWIAFYGGRRKNFFLMMLLVPFFVSFVIRTVIWEFLLSSNGFVLTWLRDLHIVSQNFHVLGTTTAVVAGLAYNFLPFTALPIYVALERIEPSLLDAADDLYASRVQRFVRVVFPLCAPGVFAAFLLTFIPAFGDYVNQQVLGGVANTMVGTIIQNLYLIDANFPAGSALSVIVMAISLVGIASYAKLAGANSLGEYV
jgi:spermidine/putrescine transport system permease protein